MANWKGTRTRLIQRIRNIICKAKFSVRDMKKLKRIVKKEYKDKGIDYDRLIYEFPGKSKVQLIKECKKIRKPQKRSSRAIN